MKALFSFTILFIIAATGFAQQDVEVFEKKEGSKVLVMARNIGKVEYAVVVTITSKGMDVSPSSKVESSIPPGYMKEMASLTPIPGSAWEYSYDVTITQSSTKITPTPAKATPPNTQTREANSPPTTTSTTNRNTTTTSTTTVIKPATTAPAVALSTANIIVYSKPGCGRCAFVKKQLTSLGIPYEEYSTTSDSPEINHMWAGLRSAGFTGETVTMPVVRVDGKYYYDIKDMQGFVNNLKK